MKNKKILSLVISLFIVISNTNFVVKALPSNEEVKDKVNSQISISSKHKMGLIPCKIKIGNSIGDNKLSKNISLPSKYDLRQQGILTDIKHQGQIGDCWSFATMASIESNLLKNEGNKYDFSEINMAVNHGFDLEPNDGGNCQMATAYFARWEGPVNEQDDPYPNPPDVSNIVPRSGLAPNKHIQNVLFLPDRTGSTDNALIKESIINYGAIYSSIYMDEYTYLSNSNGYYNYNSTSTNHAINIVGWDDNYSKDNFKVTPPENGAFICRNSWGSNFGDNGYFYVSYYDLSIGKYNAAFIDAEPTDNYSKNYQYDPLGIGSYTYYYNNSSWFSNVFTCTSNGENTEKLSAISFYTIDMNTSYEIYVESNYDTYGFTRIATEKIKSGNIEMPGYHTIKLDNPINLFNGKKFAVAVKISNVNGGKIVLENTDFKDPNTIVSKNGESFTSYDGQNWKDRGAGNRNVCLKAFTNISNGGPTTILEAGTYEDNNPAINYVGNWSKEVFANYSSGSASISNSNGSYATFKFNGTGFKWYGLSTTSLGIASVNVDGTTYTVDSYSPTATFKKLLLDVNNLTPGIHTVKIFVTSQKNTSAKNNYQVIDYIQIINKPVSTILEAGTYEDNNPAINYVGNWSKEVFASYSGGSASISNSNGAYTTFKFNGTGFKWYGLSTSSLGIASVDVDGKIYTIDSYSPTATFKKPLFDVNNLTPGTHTVKIFVTSQKNTSAKNNYQVIDYIQIINKPVSTILEAGTYEDNNPSINYVGNWSKEVFANYSGGSASISNSNGAYATFKFNGTGFKWYGLSTTSLGIASVDVDGKTYTIDSYSPTPTFKKLLLDVNNLTPGTHTVKIFVTSQKNTSAKNNYQVIDYIQIINNSVSTILEAGTYEDNNPAINYIGNWSKEVFANYSGGSASISNSNGSYATFKFNGTGFKWYGLSTSSLGIASVDVDGEIYTIDSYSPTATFKKPLFDVNNLTPGTHTVKIFVTSQKNTSAKNNYQVIDYIQIINKPVSTILEAGTYEDNNPSINYVGNWSKEVFANYSGGSASISNSNGAYATFKFNGTGFKWYGLSTTSLGIASVDVDGKTYTIDSYSPTPTFKKLLLDVNNLTPGTHTVKIFVTSQKNTSAKNTYQVIDFIQIIN